MLIGKEFWEVVRLSLGVRRDCLTVYLLCVWEKQGTRPGVSLLGGEWSEPAIFH